MKIVRLALPTLFAALVAGLGCPDTLSAQTTTFTASPNSILFCGAQNQQASFTLSTSSGASSGYTVTTNQPWLTVSPSSGISTPSSVVVTLNGAAAPTTPGVYNGVVTVTPSGGVVSAPLMVNVTLSVGQTNCTTSGAPNLTASPAALTASIPLGVATSPAQTVVITNNTQNAATIYPTNDTNLNPTNVSVAPTSQAIAPGGSAAFTVNFSSAGLAAGMVYTGNIIFTDTTGSAGSVTVPVTLCYGVSSGSCATVNPVSAAFTSNPSMVSFTVQSTGSPVQRMIAISSNIGNTTVTATSSNPNLVSINPPGPVQLVGAQPQNFTVVFNPSALPAGTTSGSANLTFTSGSGLGTPLTVPVSVNIGPAPTLTVTPQTLNFAYQQGAGIPAPQTLNLSSDTPAQFTITTSGESFLVVSPVNGATTGGAGAVTPISVQVQPGALQANNYTAKIFITNTNSGVQQTVNVNLLVSVLPVLTLSPNSVTFNYQFQSNMPPASQTVQVTSSSDPITFIYSTTPLNGANFLNVLSSGMAPGTLTLSLNPTVVAGLAPGVYAEQVNLSGLTAGNSPTLTVTLNVSNSVQLTSTASSLIFTDQIGQNAPVDQTFSIASTGTPLALSVAAQSTSPACGNFLSATVGAGNTPQTVTVHVNPANLGAQVCMGTVTVSSPGTGTASLVVPVTFYISKTALLTASPGQINAIAQVGGNPANQTINLTSTDPNTQITFTAVATTGANQASGYFGVIPNSGTTPQQLTVVFKANSLAVGSYTGTIMVTATTPTGVADSPLSIPVNLVVTSSNVATVSPTSLSFSQAFGGSAPAAQTLQITSGTPGLTFSASVSTRSGGNFLSIQGNNTGTTPGTISVVATGVGLAQGIYQGDVTILIPGAANNPIDIPVTLTVGAAQMLTLNSSALSFTYQAGASTTPAAQMVQVTSGGTATAFTTSTSTPTGTPNFLTITPTSGTTPQALTVALNQSVIATLTPNTYTETVNVNSGAGNASFGVTLTVTAGGPPTIGTVVNAATNKAGAIAPGEIVTIYGSNIGPGTAAGFTLTNAGTVPTTLSNTVVTFNGVAAPLTYVSSGQINAVVPYNLSGPTATVMVSTNGINSSAITVNVTGTNPGIFSVDFSGSGQGAILNQDGTVNSTTNPAAKGSVVQIFATGEGAPTPVPATGSVTPGTAPFPSVPNVSVTIGGQAAAVQYAGEAPGLISGVLQVNAVVPTSITGTGPQTIVLNVAAGSNMTTQTITVAVK